MADQKPLKELYLKELHHLSKAEQQMLEMLPNLQTRAENDALGAHLDEAIDRARKNMTAVEKCIVAVNPTSMAEGRCSGMDGILAECEEFLSDGLGTSEARDAAIISLCQKMEHFEIASYGTAKEFARILGQKNSALLLDECLAAFKDENAALNLLAVREVNPKAMESRS